jgi:rRNA pseudouridine-1189 N-methylase Emg1 (Nep1/Mra1 family)
VKSVEILETLLDSGAVDENTALEVLKEMHRKGIINLVKQLNEQNINALTGGAITKPVLVATADRINVMIDLMPDEAEVLSPVVEDTDVQSVADIMGDLNDER